MYDPHKAASVEDAWKAGRSGTGGEMYTRSFRGERELREAITSWAEARYQHEHTSYFGVEAIRKSLAYFLGLRRFVRENQA